MLAGGEADYSGMHTALLYAGSALVAVGERGGGWVAAMLGCWGAAHGSLSLLRMRARRLLELVKSACQPVRLL